MHHLQMAHWTCDPDRVMQVLLMESLIDDGGFACEEVSVRPGAFGVLQNDATKAIARAGWARAIG
jgi:hypothetical protein